MGDKDIITLVIFFLSFNPVLIALIVSFAYGYTEGLKMNLYNIMQSYQKGINIANNSIFIKEREDIGRYCELSDRIIFNAGVFWLLCFGIGVVQLGLITNLFGSGALSIIFAISAYIVILVTSIIIHCKIHIRTYKEEDPILNELNFYYKLSKEMEFKLWLVPFIINIVVIIICVVILLTDISLSHIRTMLFFLLAISFFYLAIWFIIAILHRPSLTLEMARWKYLSELQKQKSL